jgi:putative hydrolase of the HAD superfamily
MAIRGLVFDFGGVIMDMRWDKARQLEEQYGLEKASLFRSLYDSDDWRAVETGRGEVEAWREGAHARLEELAGKKLPYLHEEWRQSWHLITENIDLINMLRPPYRISILSNADSTLEERITNTLQLGHLFDDIVSSAVVGMAKPAPEIYQLAAERLNLQPNECVFIDDAEPNVQAARDIGMAAVHYRVHHGDKLADQLAELGVEPAPPE